MKATDKAILIDSKLDGQLFSTGFFQIRPIDGKLNSSYILHYLTSLKFTQIKDELCSGSTQSALNDEGAKKIFIPIPPFKEQELIVSKIQELLSELENGKQQLLTAQQQLKVYRQSLLKWAFEGKLTNKKVKDGELPKGWKWVKSGELFSFVTSGSRGWAKYYSDKGAIFIRITNMNFDTLELDLRDEKIQYVNPPSNSEGIRTKVQEGDFLFSITGYLGMFAIAPKLENAFVNQHVCLCRPKEGFNKKYVGYWISSRSGGIHHFNKNQKGAVKAGLNLDDLKTFPVPLCSPEEQQLIVDELESKLTVCDKIEETINQSLQQAETLRQSIFKQAFEGKLV
jgi:type I restriction enzyme, S subunit